MADQSDFSHQPRVGPNSITTLVRNLRAGGDEACGVGPIGTGFEPLDTVLEGGLLPGEVVLLGGQPGVGKTVCALQWARNIAAQSCDVTYACFEHDEATLLNRLLIQELACLANSVDSTELVRARAVVKELMLGVVSLRQAVARCPVIERAIGALESTLPHLRLLRASSGRTTPAVLEALTQDHVGMGGVLFVDYLQKVPIAGAATLDERIYRSMEAMKELAVAKQITVVALSAAGASGIAADRLRMSDLRGAEALAHECDVAIVMNQKSTAVSSRHLKFDLTQLDEARRRTVLSIEKNRRGEVDVHLEFVKDFANFRFEPRGAFLTEAMNDD
jgi:replicative DNA helicase